MPNKTYTFKFTMSDGTTKTVSTTQELMEIGTPIDIDVGFQLSNGENQTLQFQGYDCGDSKNFNFRFNYSDGTYEIKTFTVPWCFTTQVTEPYLVGISFVILAPWGDYVLTDAGTPVVINYPISSTSENSPTYYNETTGKFHFDSVGDIYNLRVTWGLSTTEESLNTKLILEVAGVVIAEVAGVFTTSSELGDMYVIETDVISTASIATSGVIMKVVTDIPTVVTWFDFVISQYTESIE